MLPFRGTVAAVAVGIYQSKQVRSRGLVVYSCIGDSMLSSGELDQEGKHRCSDWFPTQGKLRPAQTAKIKRVEERPMGINYPKWVIYISRCQEGRSF